MTAAVDLVIRVYGAAPVLSTPAGLCWRRPPHSKLLHARWLDVPVELNWRSTDLQPKAVIYPKIVLCDHHSEALLIHRMTFSLHSDGKLLHARWLDVPVALN